MDSARLEWTRTATRMTAPRDSRDALEAKMTVESSTVPDESVVHQSKGSLFRGLALVLARERMLAGVCEKVSPATAELLRNPPPSSKWIDTARAEEIGTAVAS